MLRSRPGVFLGAGPDAAWVWVQLWAAPVAEVAVPERARASAGPVRAGLVSAPQCLAQAFRARVAAVREAGLAPVLQRQRAH
jgi:hypothetical protein